MPHNTPVVLVEPVALVAGEPIRGAAYAALVALVARERVVAVKQAGQQGAGAG